jgi:hypothetical protein
MSEQQPINPYAAPQANNRLPVPADPKTIALNQVARIYRWLGWIGSVVYGLIFVSNIVVVIQILFDLKAYKEPLWFFCSITIVHGLIFWLAITYLRTSNSILRRDYSKRQTAIVLAWIMMLGFPIFTIVGYICRRELLRHFHDQ